MFINNGRHFTKRPLPSRAQVSPVFALLIDDVNNDGRKDIVAGGNLYGLKPELGRYDADYGTVLLGNGENGFTYLSPQQSGFFYQGQVRDIATAKTKKGKLMLVSRNNESLMVFKPVAHKK